MLKTTAYLSSASSPSLARWQWAVFILFVSLACFFRLAAYPILDMNEGLYAEIAREMWSQHQFIIPTLNYVPYLEKPPLLYWLIAISYQLFGVSTWAARLIPALSTAAVCSAVLYLGIACKRVQQGWWAAIILATSLGFIAIGRTVFFDMLLTACMSFSLSYFYLWYQASHRRYLYLAYAFLGLALLAKGLVAIVLAAIMAVSFLSLVQPTRFWARLLALFNPMAIGIFLAIIIPWHLAASLSLPEFSFDYFINEQWYRFLDKRIPHDYHTGPWYYYLPRIFIYLFPWSGFIPGLFQRFKGRLAQQDPLKIWLWLWLLVPLGFFSCSKAKGDYYLVISMPALAMLLAFKLTEWININRYRLLTGYTITICWLFCASAFYLYGHHHLPQLVEPSLLKLAYGLLAYAIATTLGLLYRRSSVLALLVLATLSVPLVKFYCQYKQLTSDTYTQDSLADYILNHDPQRPVYFFENYAKLSSLVFKLQRRVYSIDNQSPDLYFGSHTTAAHGWFISLPSLKQAAQQPLYQAFYIVLLKEKLPALQQQIAPLPVCIAAQSGKAYLLSNVLSDCGHH